MAFGDAILPRGVQLSLENFTRGCQIPRDAISSVTPGWHSMARLYWKCERQGPELNRTRQTSQGQPVFKPVSRYILTPNILTGRIIFPRIFQPAG